MIVPTLARMIVREHLYRPIRGKILTLGRQTVGMTYEQYIELLHQEGFFPDDELLEEITISRDQKTRYGKGSVYISDDVFFNILGIKEFHVMDVSEYEKADIMHDLNMVVPDSLIDQFDFIIDGGTFDHLVDIRTAFENIVKMLKPDGRIFQWNAASNFTGAAYISFGPDLFYDYYVLNQFADCKVYVAEVDSFGQSELWDLYEFEGLDQYGYLKSERIQMTVVLAEKGVSSTYEKIPVQSQYRDAHLWSTYKKGQELLMSSTRKPFVGSGITLQEKSRSKKRSFIKLIYSRFKEKGLIWIIGKAIRKCIAHIKQRGKKDINGFRYLGKI